MTIEQAKLALEIGETIGMTVESYGPDYSGRGMFGERTSAVTVPSARDSLRLMVEMTAATGKATMFRTDDLGRDTIVY